MTQENNDRPYSRAMVVMAHPDDAEYSCSGTVAQWCRMGWEVVYVLCTDGSKGAEEPEMTPDKLACIRKQEQLEAAKILGLKDVAFLNYPDAFLTPSLELRHDIAREIRRYRPDIVVCPSPTRNLDNNFYVGHPDHLAAGEATISAVYPTARDRLTYPDLLKEGLEPHKVRELWITMGAGANYWVELAEDDLKTAIRALMAHSSQVGDGAERRVREWRARTGSLRGMRYAESFKVFKMRG